MKFLLFVMMLVFAAPVLADDWQVTRVRGEVVQKIGLGWQPVQRGDIIPNDRYLKTGADGRVGLLRSKETIELEGNTQIRIKDAGAERMTSVIQDFGVVVIEAERRNVQHFSVQTPFLAAVVKGTRFTVRSGRTSATVDVERGVVQVQDTRNDLVADIRPGQAATVSSEAPLLVEGDGAIAVYNFDGAPVVNGTTSEVKQSDSGSAAGAAKANDAVGNGNAYGLSNDTGTSAAGNSGNANAGGNNNGKSGSSSAGGNGNSGNGNGIGNSDSNSGGNGNANGRNKESSADDTGSTTSQSADSSSSPGNSGNSNAGGNGRGKANGLNKD